MKTNTRKILSTSSNKTKKKHIKNSNSSKKKPSKKKPSKKYKGGFSRQYFNHYLDDLQISSTRNDVKDIIYEKSFGDVTYFVNAKKDIFESKYIQDLFKNNSSFDFKTGEKKWISCNSQCIQQVQTYISKEIESTAFFLRILANSVLSLNDGHLQFAINDSDVDKLSGSWEKDMDYFRIQYIGNSDDDNKIPGRLIMGFGPSASGKTFWAKSVIRMFSMTSIDLPNDFPKSFLTIDGGLYRECSQIYQFIVRSTLNKGHGGLSNLVSSGAFGSSLFSSDKIKKGVIAFLKKQISPDLSISLYVPETLGDCGHLRPKSCVSKYKIFVDITKDTDRWIGLNIYQHKLAAECTYDDEFKCTGCSESGMMRQHNEGKKYSNGVWSHSFEQGNKEIMKAPGGSFRIHNSGGKKWIPPSGNGSQLCKSIITDFSKTSLFDDEKRNMIENQFHCVYLHRPSVI
tara:strand:- start:735 stop:2102 length:1368 start_codon:yes stop_codon:yes gene_type:complete